MDQYFDALGQQYQHQQSYKKLIHDIFYQSSRYMREIVSLQVGQCGNQIGNKFWQMISEQHSILPSGQYFGDSDQQLEHINTYFNQSKRGYCPRTALIDLDPSSLEAIRMGPLGIFFNPNNFAQSYSGAGNSWPKGHYQEGAEISDDCLDIIRKEAQGCDYLQGFQLTHGLGGGTGSGLGTLLISKIKEEYPDIIIETFSVFTSPMTSGYVVEPYNNTLSLPYLIEYADNCIVLDNDALYDIFSRNLKLATISYSDLNHLIAPAMSIITSRLRFPGQIHPSSRELLYDLVPFPKLHFLMVGLAPLISIKYPKKRQLTVTELTLQIFQARNTLCDASPPHGRYLAASAIYRGKISYSQVERDIINKQIRQPLSFAEQMPNKLNFSICDTPITGYKTAAASISNSTSIQHMFRRIYDQFIPMFRRRAYLFDHGRYGMDEQEFAEAQQCVEDLMADYKMHEID